MKENETVSIDLQEIWKVLKKEKWVIIIITIIFSLIGLLYGYSLKEEFVSSGKILPEVNGRGSSVGQFAGLAALAGVDLNGSNSGSDAVRPDLYPAVLEATPFFLDLLKEKVLNRKNQRVIFLDFYIKEILDGKVNNRDMNFNFSKSENFIVLNRQTEKIIKDLKSRITCVFDRKTEVITISVKMPDPVVSADIANFSMNYLTNYIISYRIEKQNRDLNFLVKRLEAAKGKYYRKQSEKATYSDQMPLRALKMQSADLERERIESEYNLSSSFYNTLLQKYEEAKLKVQQETPVIKVLEPPTVPNLKSEPKKSIILGLFSIFGLFFSITIILFWNRAKIIKI